jgi:hypothetical protein
MSQKVIVNSDETIVCPKCSDKFPLDKGITRQTMEKYENEYEADFEKRKEEITADIKKTEEKRVRKLFDDKELALKEQLATSQEACEKAEQSAQKALDDAQKKLKDEFELERKTLQQDLEQKTAAVAELRGKELAFRKEKQSFEQQKADLELDIQRRLDDERLKIQEHITKIEAEKAKKVFDEKQIELQDRLTASEDARKKAESAVKKATDETRAKLSQEFDQERNALKQDLEQKEASIKTFREQELNLRKEKQMLVEEKANLEIDVQRRLDEERRSIQEQTIKAEADKFRLREAEYKKQLDDVQKANADLSRKLEQGSQQLQGEVLEIELETLLKSSFPHDKIEPVKKGQRGADILHHVYTPTGQKCGTIIWEAKRAENWADKWIQKLKDDQLEAKAEIAVIVTTNMPLGEEEPFLQHECVWITKDFIVKPVAQSLRIMLLEAYNLKLVNTGKNEKMESLYNYLCSPQFSQRIRAVVDTFTGMKRDLDQEKNAFAKIWKKREASIERVATNMAGMVGELEAISQESFSQLESIEQLSLPKPDDIDLPSQSS